MNIILHPWRLASEQVPKELQGKPLLIEDFLGNYTVGYFSEYWWLNVYDNEDRIIPKENVKKWIPIGSFYGSDAKCGNKTQK